jgi:hypothetical protein
LDACLDTLRLTAAELGLTASDSSSSSDSSNEAAEQGYAALRAAVKPDGDHWLLLRCKEWRKDVEDNLQRGLAGRPALALLQVGLACGEL